MGDRDLGVPGPVGRGGEPVVLRASANPGAPPTLDTLAATTHELLSLIDGSTRSLNLVLRGRNAPVGMPGAVPTPEPTPEVARRLETVRAALDQMHAVLRRAGGGTGVRARRFGNSLLTLGEAVGYAAAICEPLAGEWGVRVGVEVDPEVTLAAPGPAYEVVLNGVRNAVESLRDAPARAEKRVLVTVGMAEGDARSGALLELEVRDNGIGPPTAGPEHGHARGVFVPGFSTKPGGAGIGLALCREMVTDAGGEIGLLPAVPGPGAVLRARWPLVHPEALEDSPWRSPRAS